MGLHVKVLAVFHIALGLLGLMGSIVVLLMFGGAAGIVGLAATEDPDAWIAVPIVGLVCVGGPAHRHPLDPQHRRRHGGFVAVSPLGADSHDRPVPPQRAQHPVRHRASRASIFNMWVNTV